MTDETPPEQRLSQLMMRLRGLRLGEFPRLGVDLTFSQMAMLGFIAKAPRCHVQDIADGLGLSAPTVSVAVRRLEETGWVKRKPDPEDGRATCISLSKKSEEVLARSAEAQRRGVRQFLAGLTREEQEQFLDLFEKAIEAAVSRSQETVN